GKPLLEKQTAVAVASVAVIVIAVIFIVIAALSSRLDRPSKKLEGRKFTLKATGGNGE
uniref:Uncharacterized protein n=1 Tax=Magallana gigas TaxID=29159 RepID=A0A8W8L2N2_MAGGI